MNSKLICKKIFLLLTIVLFNAVVLNGQSIKVYSYFNALTILNSSNMELGPEFRIGNKQAGKVRLLMRLPLVDKNNGISQIDRYSDSWTAIFAASQVWDNTQSDGPTRRFQLDAQAEFGNKNYTFYPDGNRGDQQKENRSSWSGELRGAFFSSPNLPCAPQFAIQGRLRFSMAWEGGDKTSLVDLPVGNSGVATVREAVISGPSMIPQFSPAVAVNYYRGGDSTNILSHSPMLYYDLRGKEGGTTPWDNSGRLRFEFWTYIHPVVPKLPNFRIGFAPFVSQLTHGMDALESFEWGFRVQVKLGARFWEVL